MALGALSTLGAGSSGTLSYDVIDKLKAADESKFITPLENKQAKNDTLSSAISTLKTSLKALYTTANSLGSESTYYNKKSTLEGDSIKMTTALGVANQSFSLNVVSLAKRDIMQSSGFASKTTTFATSNETVTLGYGSETFNVDVTSDMTLEAFSEAINSASGGKVTASILNVGGTNPYSLVLKGKDTGADNAITLSGSTALENTLNLSHISTAADAQIELDGVTVYRDSNTMSDLVSGATIELKKTGTTTATVAYDTEAITKSVEDFVSQYNEIMTSLNTQTAYDATNKSAGVFQSVSQIKSIKNELRTMLETFTVGGKTISDFGLSLEKAGTLKLDSTTFNKALQDDPATMIDAFSNTTTGLFSKYKSSLNTMAYDAKSTFGLYESYLKDRTSILEDALEKAQTKLDDKYEIMAKKFAKYDSMMNKVTSSFSSVQMMINAMSNSDS